ncbi:transketolase [bacterium]|nr:transketolase [bacterium]
MNLSHDELRELARTIRKDVIMMTNTSSSGHPGGPLSAADYSAALIANYLRVRPAEPYWPERDRYVLSNGHCSALIFSMLSRRGFFDPGYLLTFRSTPSRLQGHPNCCKLPGVEVGAGSLGQGLSVAHGMALAAKLDGQDTRVVANVGDGEMQEGNIWEAIMHAGHRQTDNLIMAVDWNDAQIDGRVKDVKRLDPVDDKLVAFHWNVRWADGHDMGEVCDAWDWAWGQLGSGKPSAILFKTIMMKDAGEKYEDIPGWHGRPPKDDEALEILKNLGYNYSSIEEARASYGEPVYTGQIPPKMSAAWADVVKAETCEIVRGG